MRYLSMSVTNQSHKFLAPDVLSLHCKSLDKKKQLNIDVTVISLDIRICEHHYEVIWSTLVRMSAEVQAATCTVPCV